MHGAAQPHATPTFIPGPSGRQNPHKEDHKNPESTKNTRGERGCECVHRYPAGSLIRGENILFACLLQRAQLRHLLSAMQRDTHPSGYATDGCISLFPSHMLISVAGDTGRRKRREPVPVMRLAV